jgi:sensor histidine kinase regulating citrate/malate metabolism
LEHSLLVFSTPIITIVIMFFTPLKDMNYGTNRSFYTCLYVCLALLNIINYVLIERNDAQTRELFRLKQSETLVQFQQEKYKQLSSAYKANRSLIHDTKKHYFVIQKHIENKEYEKLENYLNISLSELDTICSEINTGNLVIDSFVTNCKNLCEENNITFLSDLSVDYNRIPINDYDLCIILGNILDNAVNACTCNTTANNFIRLTMTINDKDIFYIKSENTYLSSPKSHKKDRNNDFPKHGYGLNNVRNTVEANYGFMNVHAEDWFVVDIVLPIIKQPHTLP